MGAGSSLPNQQVKEMELKPKMSRIEAFSKILDYTKALEKRNAVLEGCNKELLEIFGGLKKVGESLEKEIKTEEQKEPVPVPELTPDERFLKVVSKYYPRDQEQDIIGEIELALKEGADINCKNEEGINAIHIVEGKFDPVPIVKFLIEKGCKTYSSYPDETESTFGYAFGSGQTELLKLLLDNSTPEEIKAFSQNEKDNAFIDQMEECVKIIREKVTLD